MAARNNPAMPPLQGPHTPRSSSIPDDSDTEFVPTPIHSPGFGPHFEDLPPSYDEAIVDARNGVAPLDPNQLEAHRLTLNEGPNDPEIWEYRVRGEQPDDANEQEHAPEYGTHERTVPVEHIQGSHSIPVGRTDNRSAPSTVLADPTTTLLSTALQFTRHEPDSDVQYAPRLVRPVAIPPNSLKEGDSSDFLRAYAKALHAHSIRPAEFTEFLDGLNALCKATDATADDLIHQEQSSLVHDYINGANEAFFAPRGLKVSLQSLSTLLQTLNIPTERGQQAGAIASVTDGASTAERKAQALYPWIEALETNVPSPSSRTISLQEMSDRFQNQKYAGSFSNPEEKTRGSASSEEHADPPHSIPEPSHEGHQNFGPWGMGHRGRGGRGAHHGGPWLHGPFGPGNGPFGRRGGGPFGPHNHGPFGRPGSGPFGRPGSGPFGAHDHGPFGGPGRGPFGHSRFGRGGPPHSGRGRAGSRSRGPPFANDWAAWGENIGKLGEEFGKRMGDWGQQFGKRAEAWGEEIGRAAEAGTSRASGSGTQPRRQSDDNPPPSYPEHPVGQETGILRGDSKAETSTVGQTKEKDLKMAKNADDDDDSSSISSDSSDSDSNSDGDDEDYPDTEAIFVKRIHSINEQADNSLKKGKKSPEEIAQERALAIEKAQNEKTAADLKIEEKQTKRAIRMSLNQKSRELKKQYRHRKRELRESHIGKGKGKAKKSKEWREAKREYRDQKKELRRDKMNARKEWRQTKWERRKMMRESASGYAGQEEEEMKGMVWVVVENLHHE